MTWFKADDELPMHEKFAALAEGEHRGDAIALWLFAGCWSSRALKEGFVPAGVVRSFGFAPDAASELVRVRLWVPAEGGYQFHDWADYQPSAEQVEARRKAGAERKARSRARLSGAQDMSRVGESRRDCVSVTGGVTGVPRTESRPCLADASRATGLGDLSLSSAEGEKTFQETARAQEPHIVGFNFVASLLGRSQFDVPPPGSQLRSYTWIGGRPEADRETVRRAVEADTWCRENPQWVDAKHLEERWQRYLRGAPKAVAKTDPRELDAKTRVAKLRAQFEARIKRALAEGDEYSAEIARAERDLQVSRLESRLAS